MKVSDFWKKISPQDAGFAGSMALLMAYFILLSVLNSFDHALDQFFSLWYWILALSAGFGIQIGLYAYLKRTACANTASAAEITATGGVSAGSMLGCCAHHATDFVPLLGLSAASIFLSRYQTSFMLLGIFSNIVGITMMLNAIQKHELLNKTGSFGALFKYDMSLIRNAVIVVGIAAVAASFYTTHNAFEDTGTHTLAEKVNNENGVSISAKPQDFRLGSPVKFDITLTTHSGSLDYELTKISVLQDAEGNVYAPISWDGSPPGGHHRSGILAFPVLREKTGSMALIIKGIYGIPERKFTWLLNG